MSTAVDTAISQLVAILTGAVNNLDQGQGPAQVYDGYPGVDRPFDFVVVGSGTEADASTAAQRAFVQLGGISAPGSREEEFIVVCYAQAKRGDDDQAGARAAAVALFALCEDALRANPQLNNTVGPWPVEVTTQTLTQTHPDQAATGRYAVVEFGVRVRNRY